MGLRISRLDDVIIAQNRDLYLYLLDFGWPDGKWEELFKKHFMRIAEMTAETNSVVISSPRGVHFGNEVLSYYRVGELDAEMVLPALLITKTHPSYFKEPSNFKDPAGPGLGTLLVIPLEPFCTSETDFLRAIESIFRDLREGTELQNFTVAENDFRIRSEVRSFRSDMVDAIELKPGAFGIKLDLKKLLNRRNEKPRPLKG